MLSRRSAEKLRVCQERLKEAIGHFQVIATRFFWAKFFDVELYTFLRWMRGSNLSLYRVGERVQTSERRRPHPRVPTHDRSKDSQRSLSSISSISLVPSRKTHIAAFIVSVEGNDLSSLTRRFGYPRTGATSLCPFPSGIRYTHATPTCSVLYPNGWTCTGSTLKGVRSPSASISKLIPSSSPTHSWTPSYA